VFLTFLRRIFFITHWSSQSDHLQHFQPIKKKKIPISHLPSMIDCLPPRILIYITITMPDPVFFPSITWISSTSSFESCTKEIYKSCCYLCFSNSQIKGLRIKKSTYKEWNKKKIWDSMEIWWNHMYGTIREFVEIICMGLCRNFMKSYVWDYVGISWNHMYKTMWGLDEIIYV